MAYLPMSEKEKEQQQGQGKVQAGSEQVISGSTGTVDGSGANAPVQASGGSAPESQRGGGSGWTNLQEYVKANQGADQRMGTRVEEHVGTKAGEATAAQGTFATNRDTGIQDGSVQWDQGTIDQLRDDASQFNEGSDPWQAYKTMYDAQYSGPQDYTQIDGFYDAEKGAMGVGRAVDQSRDFSGRKGLLDDVYGDGGYTAGEKSFDSFLLGAGEGGRQSMQNVQQNYGQFGEAWEKMVNDTQTQINDARTATDKVRTDAQQALQDEIEEYKGKFGGFQTDYDAAITAANTARDEVSAALQSKNPKQVGEALVKLGFTSEEAAQIIESGIDPTLFLGDAQLQTFGDFVSDKDQSIVEALGGLYGAEDLAGMLGLEALDFTDSGFDGSKGFTLAEDTAGAARDMITFESELGSRLEQEQLNRQGEYGSLVNELDVSFTGPSKKTLQTLGLDETQYKQAKAAGINFADFIKPGKALTLADVATDEERQNVANWGNALGKNPIGDLTDKNNEGAAWTFDRKGFEKALLDAITKTTGQFNMGQGTSADTNAVSKPKTKTASNDSGSAFGKTNDQFVEQIPGGKGITGVVKSTNKKKGGWII